MGRSHGTRPLSRSAARRLRSTAGENRICSRRWKRVVVGDGGADLQPAGLPLIRRRSTQLMSYGAAINGLKRTVVIVRRAAAAAAAAAHVTPDDVIPINCRRRYVSAASSCDCRRWRDFADTRLSSFTFANTLSCRLVASTRQRELLAVLHGSLQGMTYMKHENLTTLMQWHKITITLLL